MQIPPTAAAPPGAAIKQPLSAKAAAEKLETAFLSEMLKAAGVGKTPSEFGGGAGEDHFSSFLREAQAREIAKAGGVGLARHFESILGGHYADIKNP